MTQSGSGALVSPVHGVLAGAVFGAFLLSACASDLRTRRVPNVLVGCVALCGLTYSLVQEPWLPGAARALEGLGVGLLVWLPFYLLRMIGAGDVKFFAAAATWLGVQAALQAALLAAVLGAALALMWMVRTDGWRGAIGRAALSMQQPLRASGPAAASVAPPAHRVPYAVAMAMGLAISAWFPYLPR